MANKLELWTLGLKAEKASKLPSECVPGLADEIGEWGVYCFDNAVGFFVGVIQGALYEREKVGDEWQPKYKLSLLLTDDFYLPKPPTLRKARTQQGLRAIALANPGIFTRWKEVKAS